MLLELGKVAEEKNQLQFCIPSTNKKMKLKRDTISNSVKTVKNQDITLSKSMLRPTVHYFPLPGYLCFSV